MKGQELLGHTVSDHITGFTGVVTGFVVYLTGCNQALVVPKVGDDGSSKEAQWFDEQRLKVNEMIAPIRLNNGSTPGFDKAPPRR